MTLSVSCAERDILYDRAKEHRRMIKQTLDQCTDPFVCRECRRKLNLYVSALLHLPDTILEFPCDMS
jgi:hypothetical protein